MSTYTSVSNLKHALNTIITTSTPVYSYSANSNSESVTGTLPNHYLTDDSSHTANDSDHKQLCRLARP